MNRTANKGDVMLQSQTSLECCMCGDSGLTAELFQCKVCQFRSQHRYCSNLYPKAESYKACNWCLSEKEDTKEKLRNSSNSSASCKNSSEDDSKINITKKNNNNNGGLKKLGVQRNSSGRSMQPKSPIKKLRSSSSPERTSLPTTPRKRIITASRLEEKLRRTKSEEMSRGRNGLITKHVFRNKVRRYKLLEEVSC